MEGEVGRGAGLKETKKTAFVNAPDTFCRCIEEGFRWEEVHMDTF
jgi:hypothetical protein